MAPDWRNFECHAIAEHWRLTRHETCAWQHVPEAWLYESGFIHDFNALRMARTLRTARLSDRSADLEYYSPLQDTGLDGMARDGNVHHGLQAKAHARRVACSDLGGARWARP
jgi:hypothetical protein